MNSDSHTIRVRYSESDQMGIAHHAAYIVWLEECRIEMLRKRGCSYRELEKQGILLPVIDITIKYKRSLRFDDEATCVTTATLIGPSRIAFNTVISFQDSVCAEATVTLAGMSPEGRPLRIPAFVLTAMGANATSA